MDSDKCEKMLQQAYNAYLAGMPNTNTGGFDLCNDELAWLENENYIEITKHYTQGCEYCITPTGISFMEFSKI